MIDLDTFKAAATTFRRRAKQMGFNRRMTTLLDLYAYAHFGRPYAVMHHLISTRQVATPPFPPPHLASAGERYGVDPVRLLEVLSPCNASAETREALTFEILADRLAGFQEAAQAFEVKLGEEAIEDFFCRAHFDCPLDDVLAALESGDSVTIGQQPEFLASACLFLNVSVRQAMTVFAQIGR